MTYEQQTRLHYYADRLVLAERGFNRLNAPVWSLLGYTDNCYWANGQRRK